MEKPLIENYGITESDIDKYLGADTFKWYYFILPHFIGLIILFLWHKPQNFSEVLLGLFMYAMYVFPIIFFIIIVTVNWLFEKKRNRYPNVKKYLDDNYKYSNQQYSKLSKYFEQLNSDKLKKELFRACQFSGFNPTKIDIDNFYVQFSEKRVLICLLDKDKELQIKEIENILQLKTQINATSVRILAKSDFLYPYDIDKRNKAKQLLTQNIISIHISPTLILPIFKDKLEDVDNFINANENYQQLLSKKDGYCLKLGDKLCAINADKLNPNKESFFEILLYNCTKRKNIYYLLDSSNNIIAEKDERDVINSNVYKESLKVFDIDRIQSVIHKWKNYSFICKDKKTEIDEFEKLHKEYKEAVLINEKNKMLGSYGNLAVGENGELIITKYSQYSIMDENGSLLNELEFSPNFYISIKNNKFAILKKEKNRNIIIVNYGIYDFIGCISETFLLVRKPNKKNLNDEICSHWPVIPKNLYSIIDKYGNNVIQDSWYRHINILSEKEVELCSGRNFDRKKIFNLYTQDEKIILPSVKLPFESDDIDYTWDNSRFFKENIVLADVIKDDFSYEGVKIIDIKQGKIISKLFDDLEYFDKDYCIVFDAERNQYSFINAAGEVYDNEKWKGSENTKICIIDANWYLKNDDSFLNTNKYDCIYPLANNRAIVKNNELYGVINEKGKQIIDCQYTQITTQNNEFFLVNDNQTHTLYDKNGSKLYESCKSIDIESIIYTNEILVLPCEKIVYTIDGQTIVGNKLPEIYKKYSENDILKYSNSMNIHDRKTMELIKWYAKVWKFEEGCAIVTDGNKFGFIDETGKEISPCIYDKLYPFKNGIAAALLNDEYIFLDKNNKKINISINFE